MTTPAEQENLSQNARAALIDAGMQLFGAQGFDGTSIRQIAAKAGVNVALISYHFGGKSGLRRACAQEVIGRIAQITAVGKVPVWPVGAALTQAQALAHLEQIIRVVTSFMYCAPQAAPMVAFMMQELLQNGPDLPQIYDDFVGPKHSELSLLWAEAAQTAPDSDDVRLSVFALIGQILYFRLARPLVLRKMGWQVLSTDEARQIADVIIANLRLTLRAGKGE